MDDFEKEIKLLTIEESGDHLNQLEEILNTKDYDEVDQDDIDTIFRIAHSIKGNTRASGFQEIAEMAHEYESRLATVKKEGLFNEAIYRLSLAFFDSLVEAMKKLSEDLEASLDFSAFMALLDAPEEGTVDALEEIPTKLPPPPAEAPINRDDSQQATIKPAEYHILIADDDPEVVAIIQAFINEKLDASYVCKANGQDALNIASEEVFDVIISDFKMPVLDGGSFIRLIRAQPNPNQKTPIIFISGERPVLESSKDTWEDVFFIDKPFNQAQLVYYIRVCRALRD